MTEQIVIIFDGPDISGKTTIAKALSSLLAIPYYKNPGEKNAFAHNPEWFDFTMRYGNPMLFSFLAQTGYSAILDRGYSSEAVYPAVYRDTPINWKAIRSVDDDAQKLGVCFVIPYRTSYAGVAARRPEESNDEEKLALIKAGFFSFAEFTRCDKLMLCVDGEDLTSQLEKILSFLVETGRL